MIPAEDHRAGQPRLEATRMNGPPTMKDQQQAQPLRTKAVEPRPAEADEPQSGLLAAEVRALSRLNEASSRLWHVSDLREGLQEILAAAVALLGSDKAIAQLLGDNGRLRLVAQHGFDQAFLDFLRDVGPDDCPTCVRALQTGQRVIIEDVDVGELYAPLRAAAKAAGYRSVQSTPILSRDGRRLGVLSTYHRVPHRPNDHALRLLDLHVQQAADFIDRCRAEQRLRESEQRLRALSDIAPGTILWTTSPGGGCSFVTRGWHEYTGQSAEQALGAGWLEPVHADNRERARRILNDAAQRREPFVLDYRLRRSDGEYRWVLRQAAHAMTTAANSWASSAPSSMRTSASSPRTRCARAKPSWPGRRRHFRRRWMAGRSRLA